MKRDHVLRVFFFLLLACCAYRPRKGQGKKRAATHKADGSRKRKSEKRANILAEFGLILGLIHTSFFFVFVFLFLNSRHPKLVFFFSLQ